MTLSIKNDRYTFLEILDLILSISLWKWFWLLQILNLSIKHLIKLILYDNDVKILKFKRRPVYVYLNFSYVGSVRFWLLVPEMTKKVTE